MSKKSIRIEIDENLHKKLALKAAVTGTPTTSVVRKKLHAYVDEEHPIILLPDEPDEEKEE